MNSQHPIWNGIGFGAVPFVVLLLGYVNVHPEFFRSVPSNLKFENGAPEYSIAWSESEQEDPPLEYISDSLRGTTVVTESMSVQSFWDLWNRPDSEVEYIWRFKVKNLTDEQLRISVTYKLKGDDDEVIESSDSSEIAKPKEVVEISGLGVIDYADALRVSDTGWSIGRKVID